MPTQRELNDVAAYLCNMMLGEDFTEQMAVEQNKKGYKVERKSSFNSTIWHYVEPLSKEDLDRCLTIAYVDNAATSAGH